MKLILYLLVGGSAALFEWMLFWLLNYEMGIYYLLAACFEGVYRSSDADDWVVDISEAS